MASLGDKKDKGGVHVAMLWQALICSTSAQGVRISLFEKTIVLWINLVRYVTDSLMHRRKC